MESALASAASRCWFCICCANQFFCLGELADERELAPTLACNESSKGIRCLLGGAGFGDGERSFSQKKLRTMEAGSRYIHQRIHPSLVRVSAISVRSLNKEEHDSLETQQASELTNFVTSNSSPWACVRTVICRGCFSAGR